MLYGHLNPPDISFDKIPLEEIYNWTNVWHSVCAILVSTMGIKMLTIQSGLHRDQTEYKAHNFRSCAQTLMGVYQKVGTIFNNYNGVVSTKDSDLLNQRGRSFKFSGDDYPVIFDVLGLRMSGILFSNFTSSIHSSVVTPHLHDNESTLYDIPEALLILGMCNDTLTVDYSKFKRVKERRSEITSSQVFTVAMSRGGYKRIGDSIFQVGAENNVILTNHVGKPTELEALIKTYRTSDRFVLYTRYHSVIDLSRRYFTSGAMIFNVYWARLAQTGEGTVLPFVSKMISETERKE